MLAEDTLVLATSVPVDKVVITTPPGLTVSLVLPFTLKICRFAPYLIFCHEKFGAILLKMVPRVE